MAHDTEPHMSYTNRDLGRNLIIRYAAFTQDPVEVVHYHKHYSLNWTKERGVEHIPYADND